MDYFACARAFLSGGLARRFSLFSDAQKGVRRVLDRACVRRVEEGVFLIEKKENCTKKRRENVKNKKKLTKNEKNFSKGYLQNRFYVVNYGKKLFCYNELRTDKQWKKSVLLI